MKSEARPSQSAPFPPSFRIRHQPSQENDIDSGQPRSAFNLRSSGPPGSTASRDLREDPGGSFPSTIVSEKEKATLAKHSKRYRALREQAPRSPVPLPEAVETLKKFDTTKFDQTVEVSTNLGIDPRQSDQNVRGSVALPHGIGKTIRVAVFAKGDNVEAAREAGADLVGAEDLAQQVKDGVMEFDVALATPDVMGVVGPLGRILGPRGLMPSPRSGTVTTDIASAVREFKAGKIEFRNDKGGNVAAPVGKLSFPADHIAENVQAFVSHLRTMKPSAAKGRFIQSVTVSATMSPGIPITL